MTEFKRLTHENIDALCEIGCQLAPFLEAAYAEIDRLNEGIEIGKQACSYHLALVKTLEARVVELEVEIDRIRLDRSIDLKWLIQRIKELEDN